MSSAFERWKQEQPTEGAWRRYDEMKVTHFAWATGLSALCCIAMLAVVALLKQL